jgi:hypothetical protein
MKDVQLVELAARILVSIACVFCGTILPFIHWESARITNVFWDIVYGIGLFLGGFLPGGLRSGPAFFVGVVVWVPVVTIAIFILSGYLLHLRSNMARVIIALFFLATFCFNVDGRVTQKEPYYRLPFFSNFIQVMF